MSEKQATITAKANRFEQMITQAALEDSGGDPPWIHSDLYIEIDEDEVTALVSAGGGSVLTYCTFEESFFDEIEGEARAIMDVEKTLDRLNVAADKGRMAFDFIGPDDGLAERLRARGALQMAVTLPASEKALDKVPDELPDRFDGDENFLSPSGNPHQTHIDTSLDEVRKIVDAVGIEGGDTYPIAVEDGDFTLNVGGDLEYFRGDLEADVDGPDLKNHYSPGFTPMTDTLSGGVVLQTTPHDDGLPLAVIQDNEGSTIRHVLASVNPE